MGVECVLLGLSRAELTELVLSCDQPRYRSDQIFMYLMRGCKNIDDMSYVC